MLTKCPRCKKKLYTSTADIEVNDFGTMFYICPHCGRGIMKEEAAAREVIA